MSQEEKQERRKVVLRAEFPDKVQLVSMPDDVDIEIVPTEQSKKAYGTQATKMSMPEMAEAEKLALETVGKLNMLVHQIPNIEDVVDLSHFKEIYDMCKHVSTHATRVFDMGMLRTDLYHTMMSLADKVVGEVANRMFTHPVWKHNVANKMVTFNSSDNYRVDSMLDGTDLGRAVLTRSEAGKGFWFISNEFLYLAEAVLEDFQNNNPDLRLSLATMEDVYGGPFFVWSEIPETLIACLENKEIPWRTPATSAPSS